jgi:hypothetical protein
MTHSPPRARRAGVAARVVTPLAASLAALAPAASPAQSDTVVIASAAYPPARVAHARLSVRDLLPVGELKVDIMEPTAPARLVELKEKLEQAVRRDTAFFAEYLRRGKPDPNGPLPYHPKMGITEEEYEELLTLPNEEGMKKIGEATLVVREQDGHLLLDGGDPLPAVRAVDIDLGRDVVRTSLGELTERLEVSPSFAEQSVTGPWRGVQWRMTNVIAAFVSFGLGRLEESGRGILYYEMKYVDDAGHVGAMRTMLVYDLPQHEMGVAAQPN